ncbi:MAG: hypothetical protein NT014_07935 [Candidatus Omnitrophica bacterium]|nr:hypothetical protein [Candidatus Omnitrophota bacterium]
MSDNTDKIIEIIYKKYKAGQTVESHSHADEEALACFLEGRLAQEEAGAVKSHLLECQCCAEFFAARLRLKEVPEIEVPEELITRARLLAAPKDTTSTLEILLKVKDNLLELLNTTGNVLVGQELMPAPVLRTRKISEFKDQITILRDFPDIIVETKIENKGSGYFDLRLVVKDKENSQIMKDVRVTLLRDDLELESYLSDSGKVIFEHVAIGKYSVELSSVSAKLAVILLEIKQ